MDRISIKEARWLALAAQGLNGEAAPFGTGKSGVLKAVEHLGYVQIDTISAVERAHHHVLWSRVPDYSPEWLHELVARDRGLFEYWSHAASYLPMRDYRFSLPRMHSFRRGRHHWAEPSADLNRAMKRVLRQLRESGPIRLRDIESAALTEGAWGIAKIEKRAIHELWMQGRVMIRERSGFQKIYDLPERVLPPDTNLEKPRSTETAEFRIRRCLRAHGIARENELGYLATGEEKAAIRKVLKAWVKKGAVRQIRVAGCEAKPCYMLPENPGKGLARPVEKVRILSPFDNLVIQRARLKWLFDFDYQIECYVPAAKRKYGYFVLPILHGDEFIGRLDAKAEREPGKLVAQKLYFEPGARKSGASRIAITEALDGFAAFNRCREVEWKKQPREALKNF